jgi:hypothetical protein
MIGGSSSNCPIKLTNDKPHCPKNRKLKHCWKFKLNLRDSRIRISRIKSSSLSRQNEQGIVLRLACNWLESKCIFSVFSRIIARAVSSQMFWIEKTHAKGWFSYKHLQATKCDELL